MAGVDILAYKDKPKDEDGGDEEKFSLESMKVVTHQDRVFDDLWRLHHPGHVKGMALRRKVADKHGRIIPQWVQVRIGSSDGSDGMQCGDGSVAIACLLAEFCRIACLSDVACLQNCYSLLDVFCRIACLSDDACLQIL